MRQLVAVDWQRRTRDHLALRSVLVNLYHNTRETREQSDYRE